MHQAKPKKPKKKRKTRVMLLPDDEPIKQIEIIRSQPEDRTKSKQSAQAQQQQSNPVS